MAVRSSEFAEDSAEVEVLFAQTKKHEEIGRKILASLGRIKESGSSLQDAVGPVYSDTQRLQVMERSKCSFIELSHHADSCLADVAKVLAAIEKLQKPLDGTANEEKIIFEGYRFSTIP